MSAETSASLRYKVAPLTGAPGSDDVLRFERDLLNAGGERPDEFGFTAAENLEGIDAGGDGAGGDKRQGDSVDHNITYFDI